MSDIDTTVKDYESGVKKHDLTNFQKEVNSELIVRSSNQQHSAEYLKGLNDELHKHGFPADLEIVGADKDHVKAKNIKTNEVVNLDEEVKKADVPEPDQKGTEKGDKPEEKKTSVPSDTEHEVKKTETLWGIARDELTKRLGHKPTNKEVSGLVKEISEHNKLENPNLILPGQKILIPADKSSANADVPVVKPVETPPIVKPVETPPVVKPGETPPVVKPGETPPVVKPVETPPVVKPVSEDPVRVSGVRPLTKDNDKPIHVGDIAAKDADEYINEYDYFFGPKVDRQRAVEDVKASMTPEAWQKLNAEQKQVSTAEMSDYLYKNFDKISDNNGVASPEKIAQAIKETNDPHEKAILMAVLLNQKEIDSMDYDLSLRTGFTFDDVKALHYEVEQQRAAIAAEQKAA